MRFLKQVFDVNNQEYPYGVFLSSINLYFFSKDDSNSVSIYLGPLDESGNPNENSKYRNSEVNVPSGDISTSNDGLSETKFTFTSPIFLKPGRHYFAVKTNTDKFRLFKAIHGDIQIGTENNIIPSVENVGKLYFPQATGSTANNETSSTTDESLKFTINRCKFDTSGSLYLTNDPSIGTDEILYQTMLITFGKEGPKTFPTSDMTFNYKKTNIDGIKDTSWNNFIPNRNINLSQSILTENALDVQVNMNTSNDSVAPVIDLDKASVLTINNNINNDDDGEEGLVGGNAFAKYVTKTVELLPDFEANDITAYALLKLPIGTDVDIYYKVSDIGVPISTVKYHKLDKEAMSTPKTDQFVEYKFSTPNGYAIDATTYFNQFMFKIVMLSSDPAKVPLVKEFRGIAVYD